MDFVGFPIIVGWELTLACNLRCGHCGSTAGLPRANELSTAEALDICGQFPDLLVHEVDFTGGEPLVRSDWWRIAERLADLGIKTKLITNGLLLGPDTVYRMKDSGIARVGISIDGLESTHDRIRNCPGLFRRILFGIDLLLKAGVQVSAISTVNALNIGEMPDLYFLIRSLGVDIWQFQPVFPLGRAQDNRELSLDERTYMEMGRFAGKYCRMSEEGFPKLTPGDSFGYFTDADLRQPAWQGCSAGIDLCGITSDGRVKGCLSMPDELSTGDLRRSDLWDIWFDEKAFAGNREFSSADLGPNCHACEYGERCRGGCSSMSYACTGRMHNDPYCFHGILCRT